MDIKCVNAPNFENSLSNKDLFVYTCYLPPGYHKVLIYDPQIERAFVKDFVVNLNSRDVFPEYPIKVNLTKESEKAPNIWRTWHEDTKEGKLKSF